MKNNQSAADVREAIENGKSAFDLNGTVRMGQRKDLGKFFSVGKFTAKNLQTLITSAERVPELEAMVERLQKKPLYLVDHEGSHEISAIKKENTALKQSQGWRDIESAPKDGTWVLLSGGKTDEDLNDDVGDDVYRPVVGRFDEVRERWDYEVDGVVEEERWDYCYWDGSWQNSYINPTHWMPLPLAPESEA